MKNALVNTYFHLYSCTDAKPCTAENIRLSIDACCLSSVKPFLFFKQYFEKHYKQCSFFYKQFTVSFHFGALQHKVWNYIHLGRRVLLEKYSFHIILVLCGKNENISRIFLLSFYFQIEEKCERGTIFLLGISLANVVSYTVL